VLPPAFEAGNYLAEPAPPTPIRHLARRVAGAGDDPARDGVRIDHRRDGAAAAPGEVRPAPEDRRVDRLREDRRDRDPRIVAQLLAQALAERAQRELARDVPRPGRCRSTHR
jgi:hypothetical protein